MNPFHVSNQGDNIVHESSATPQDEGAGKANRPRCYEPHNPITSASPSYFWGMVMVGGLFFVSEPLLKTISPRRNPTAVILSTFLEWKLITIQLGCPPCLSVNMGPQFPALRHVGCSTAGLIHCTAKHTVSRFAVFHSFIHWYLGRDTKV